MCLEFGERHFDRIEVWTVGRQEQDPGAACQDCLFGHRALVSTQVVEDDDITLLEGRGELRLDIGLEDASVHRPIDDKRRRQPMTSQPGDEGLGLPVSKRCLGLEALALCAATTQARHLGAGAGLVNEDEPVSFEPHLRLTLGQPFIARLPDVGSILLAGQQRFF